MMDEEIEYEVEELAHQARTHATNPSTGTRYALQMAIETARSVGASNSLIARVITEAVPLETIPRTITKAIIPPWPNED